MFALERTLAVLRYCDCSACFAQRSPKLSAATVSLWGGTNTHMLMVTFTIALTILQHGTSVRINYDATSPPSIPSAKEG